MAMDYSALKTECLTDPTGLGLTTWFQQGADGKVAELLNTPRAGINIGRTNVTPQEVLEAIDLADITTNAGGSETWKGSWFESVMQMSALQLRKLNAAGTNLIDTRVMTNIKALLTNASASETRLRTVGQRTGSRAEQLFGENTVVTANDVATARSV